MEFDKKLQSGIRRITQNAACKGNVSIEINKLSTESFKSKNNEIVSGEHREHYLEECGPVQFQSSLRV